MLLRELLLALQESGFLEVFKNHGFQITYKWEEVNNNYRQHNRYVIGFNSYRCKMICYYESGGISVLLGTLSDDFDKLESAGWVSLSDLIAYILKRPINWDNPKKGRPHKEQITEILSEIASDFEPLSEQILQMFQDQKIVVQWKPQLKQYVEEEFQRRFGP